MKIEGVIFDYAGTTMDYGCFSPVAAFIKAFKNKGIDITIEEAREPMGKLKIDHTRDILAMKRVENEFEKIYQRNYKDEDVLSIYNDFEKVLFSSLKEYSKLNPYVLDTIEKLRGMGVKIGSTTGYTKEMMDIVLPALKEKGYVPDFCIASDEVSKGRPEPLMMVENARALDLKDMSKVIKIGDTVVDIQEGKNAGAYSVAIIKGSSELGLTQSEVENMDEDELLRKMKAVREKFYENGADFVIDDMRELIYLIDEISSL